MWRFIIHHHSSLIYIVNTDIKYTYQIHKICGDELVRLLFLCRLSCCPWSRAWNRCQKHLKTMAHWCSNSTWRNMESWIIVLWWDLQTSSWSRSCPWVVPSMAVTAWWSATTGTAPWCPCWSMQRRPPQAWEVRRSEGLERRNDMLFCKWWFPEMGVALIGW